MANKDWITYEPESGNGNGSLVVSSTPNLTPYPRSGVVTVQNQHREKPQKTIEVTQEGLKDVLRSSDGIYLRSSDGTYLRFKS